MSTKRKAKPRSDADVEVRRTQWTAIANGHEAHVEVDFNVAQVEIAGGDEWDQWAVGDVDHARAIHAALGAMLEEVDAA